MNKVFKLAPLALAVAALSLSGAVYADGGGDDRRWRHNYQSDGSARAKVDEMNQDSERNLVISKETDNDAVLNGNFMQEANGNLGVNNAAGDNNVQSNAAALAASDAGFVFGRRGRGRSGGAYASVKVDQQSKDNDTFTWGSTNTAKLSGDALKNASGNIGVNNAAGSNNVQSNALAMASTKSRRARARVDVDQNSEDNMTHNLPSKKIDGVHTVDIDLDIGLKGHYGGVGFGGYKGTSVQSNDVYPEIWLGGPDHPQGSKQIGHIDYDNKGTNDGKFEFDEKGHLGFIEVGKQRLHGSITGSIDIMTYTLVRHQNKAKLTGNALKNASGNIGVNNAAGTNNVQNNSLSLSSGCGGCDNGGGHGGGIK